MNKKHLLMTALFVLFLFSFPPPSRAETPTERVKDILNKVLAIQNDPQLQGQEFREQRRAAIKKIIAGNFDFDAMAEQALGRHWHKLNRAQRSEFKSIFQDLFQDSYTRLVLDFLGQEKILYTKEEQQEGRTWVGTIILRTQEEISVDYAVKKTKKGWRVQDVKIDDVSIVKNYRKSFARVIQRESYSALLKKMRLQQQTIGQTS